MKKFRWDKKYLYWGVTAFSVIVGSILLFWLIQRWGSIWSTVSRIVGVLSPFVWGLVISYLLSPVSHFFERKVYIPLMKRAFKKNVRRCFAAARVLTIATSLIILLTVLFMLLWLVLPQLYSSVESIVINMQDYVPKGIQWIEDTLQSFPQAESFVVSVIDNVSEALTDWIKNTLMPQMSDTISSVSSGVISVVMGVFDVLIGLIISCYLMYNKETFQAQGKKILHCIFPEKRVGQILNGLCTVDQAFMGFISGKLLDSLIIGILCYIVCSILKMPYVILISVFIGVTNIIPFFGPFIGAIPCTLIVLMVSPVKALIFVVFVFLLQQFDGNILGPKILGNSTGLNGFWVMFAILVGGGLFGFIGMLCGVPVFSVIYLGIKNLVNARLSSKGLPKDTDCYKSEPRAPQRNRKRSSAQTEAEDASKTDSAKDSQQG